MQWIETLYSVSYSNKQWNDRPQLYDATIHAYIHTCIQYTHNTRHTHTLIHTLLLGCTVDRCKRAHTVRCRSPLHYSAPVYPPVWELGGEWGVLTCMA